jgi:hypothetical protein
LLLVVHTAHAGSASPQAGEDRWVPSLGITAGFTFQEEHTGSGASFTRDLNDVNSTFTELREPVAGDDTVVSPFVGGTFELMSPALPISTRPRIFIGGDILPTFAPGRDLGVQGDPSCVRGPEPKSPCAVDENGRRRTPFSAASANGTGTVIESRVGSLTYGAHFGVSFPFEFADRQFRIKPSVGWINFKVSTHGLIVDAACSPVGCTDFTPVVGSPPTMGFLRETRLTVRDSQHFNGIGPGLDLEMDTGQYGPVGVSLFIGGRAYRILEDRKISSQTSLTINDQLGNDEVRGQFEVEIDKWVYRAHVGMRIQFIGL